jgi:hypothetical protein
MNWDSHSPRSATVIIAKSDDFYLARRLPQFPLLEGRCFVEFG